MNIDDKLLTQALTNSNNRFMDNLPTDMEIHSFSTGFARKMKHLVDANKKYGGKLWVERVVNYSVKVAIIILCLITINFISVKAFDVNIWNIIITKSGEFLNINFKKPRNDFVGTNFTRLKIVDVPEGYEQQENYYSDNMSVQQFITKGGSITYTESLISETADLNIENGNRFIEQIGDWQVSFITRENSITAFFVDEKYYHIVEIQGVDANEEFAGIIIEELEER